MTKIFNKSLIVILICVLFVLPVYSRVDRTSEEYLKNKKHLTPITPVVENFAQTVVKSALKKETGRNFKVKFAAYTLSSMRKGIFKSMEVYGNDVVVKGLNLSYVHLKTLTDYNWIDYRQNPPVFKSDINCAYEIGISESALNTALDLPEYQEKLKKVNKKAYPLFAVNDVDVKVNDSKMKIIIVYNFPLTPEKKDRVFAVSTNFFVKDGKIYARNISIEKKYGTVSMDKIKNLINLLNPLSYILDFMNPSNCNFKIENVNIVDDIIQIDGKILIKGEQK